MNKKITYINQYNKENYKMYQFRIKKEDNFMINYLDNVGNRNSYIFKLIKEDIKKQNGLSKNNEVLTIKQIKNRIFPILKEVGINEIYLFGSYARGEANEDSDIDLYVEKGNIKTFYDQEILEEKLEQALNKKIDLIFTSSKLGDYFKKQMMEDLIKLC